VRQPTTTLGGPPNLLDIHLLTKKVGGEMVAFGRNHVKQELRNVRFSLPPAQQIVDYLETLIASVCRIFGLKKNGDRGWWFRAKVMMPYDQELHVRYQSAMDHDDDEAMSLPRSSGLSGFCYMKRRPMICNVGDIRILSEAGTLRDEPEKTFNMTTDQINCVRKDRTWMACTPIFDPVASYPSDGKTSNRSAASSRGIGQYDYTYSSPFDGAVFGTIALDVGWKKRGRVKRTFPRLVEQWYADAKLEPDPSLHHEDPRVQLVIAIMQGTAIQLGRSFSDFFAVK
jgi:hypothetical protein